MQQPESTIEYRFKSIEQELDAFKKQLQEYVREKEHNLQLTNLSNTAGRVENEVQHLKDEVRALNAKLMQQQAESERRDNAQRESQAILQIRVLWGIVSLVITVLTALLIAFLTGFIGR